MSVFVCAGPPGPKPWDLVPKIPSPILVLWGDQDKLTPADGPVGKYFLAMPETRPNTKFVFLPGRLVDGDRGPDNEVILRTCKAMPTYASTAQRLNSTERQRHLRTPHRNGYIIQSALCLMHAVRRCGPLPA